MPKLWIVHRTPQQRVVLARLAGLPESEVATGAPSRAAFAESGPPDAVLLGLEGDFEQELEFVHRHRDACAGSRWLLVCRASDAEDARRLFAAVEPEIVVAPPTARSLRARIAAASAHREAASLAERRQRERIAERFSTWLGGVEVNGLLRALDPSLAGLPLLVRGRPGSGRALLCHYVELYRGAPGRTLRLHARDLDDLADLPRRLRHDPADGGARVASVWIDEVDRLAVSAQATLAEWIAHGLVPSVLAPEPIRWIATAGPAGLDDALEPALEQAFAPLVVEVPALADHPECLPTFVEEVVRDWTRTVGGPPRRFTPGAIDALAAYPWSGDRAELEAVLRTTLAGTGRESIEEADLRFPSDAVAAAERADTPGPSSETIRALAATPEEVEAGEGLPPLPTEESDEAAWPTPAEEPSRDAEEPSRDVEEPSRDVEEPSRDAVEPRAEVTAPSAATVEPPAIRVEPESGSEPDESERLAVESLAEAARPDTPAGDDHGAEATLAGAGWRRLARSLSHEIRNPLVSIRTFAELLPEHFDDETFRSRFTELVGKDVAHISDVLSRLSRVAEREKTELESVDVSSLLEALLEERRPRITEGRLLVLRELERDRPHARADAEGLRIALAGLLDRALESLPERGDLFVATRWIERSADGRSKLRVLLRHHDPSRAVEREVALEELEPTANLLEYVLAEAVVQACGGSLTVDSTDGGETLILIDLPTAG